MMKKSLTMTIAAVLAAGTGALSLPALSQRQLAFNGSNVLSSQASANASARLSEDQRILHLLNRITFGPTAEDVELIKRIGVDAYIQSQLDPQSIPQKPQINQLVYQSEALSAAPSDLLKRYSRAAMIMRAKAEGISDKKELQKKTALAYRDIQQQLLYAKLVRNMQSPRQLEEVMTDFWYNHFNISINKGPMDRFLVGSFEQQAIRPYALGNFRQLLGATAHHPAMLFYLDNWQNTDPNSQGARGKFKGINENYARELMELHTLGVDGGYTQQDVVSLAHILTGLGLPTGFQFLSGRVPVDPSGCYFDQRRHDFGTKQLLGQTIRGQGEAEIEQALDLLAAHPSTAHHISYQLAQYFVSDNPPKELVDRLSQTFLNTRGDIKAVMSDLLHSPEFWDAKTVSSKYKSPYRYALSVLRTSGSDVQNYRRVAQFLSQTGQPIYGCLTPDGYKNTQDAWLNPDGLLKRIAFARAVVGGGLGRVPSDEAERVAKVVAPTLSSQTESAIAKSDPRQRPALMLGAPEFMTY